MFLVCMLLFFMFLTVFMAARIAQLSWDLDMSLGWQKFEQSQKHLYFNKMHEYKKELQHWKRPRNPKNGRFL